MKKAVFLLTVLLSAVLASQGQANKNSGFQHRLAGGFQVPIGVFTSTHSLGISTGYSWSNHRFGNLRSKPAKLFGFAGDIGFDFYLGKKVDAGGYEFRFGNYLYLHAFGGAIVNPTKKTSVMLTAGPTTGFYFQTAELGYGAKLDASYQLSDQLAISPGLILMKQALVNTLWAVSIKVAYDL